MPLTKKEINNKINVLKKQIGHSIFSWYRYSLTLSPRENSVTGSLVQKLSGFVCRQTPYGFLKQVIQDVTPS